MPKRPTKQQIASILGLGSKKKIVKKKVIKKKVIKKRIAKKKVTKKKITKKKPYRTLKKNAPTPVDRGIKPAKTISFRVKDKKTGKIRMVTFRRRARKRKPLKNPNLKCWAEAVAKVARGNPASGRIKKGTPLYNKVHLEYQKCMRASGHAKLLKPKKK